MEKIILDSGDFALVDYEDYLTLNRYRWLLQDKGNGLKYARRKSNGHWILMHQMLLCKKPGLQTDHKDGDGLNNQRSNLRYATATQSAQNRGKIKKTCSSIFKGVSWNKRQQRWMVEIIVNGKRFYLGRFEDQVEAALAYNKAAITYFGDFARINQILEHQGITGASADRKGSKK